MREKQNYTLIETLVVLGSIVPLTLMRGWVLVNIWGWFITRLGVPAIGIVEGLGISLMIGFLTGTDSIIRNQVKANELLPKEDREPPLGYVAQAFINPLVTLGLAWILQKFL